MEEIYIEVPSFWNVNLKNDYIVQGSDVLVVLLPGQHYTTFGPLLYYSYNIALQLGYDVLAIDYGYYKAGKELSYEGRNYVIQESKEAIKKAIELNNKYKKIIFIGKSLGTAIQNKLIDAFEFFDQKHIFLTPIPECIDGIMKSKSLIIVGSEDKFFTDEHVNMVKNHDNVKVKIIKRGNHDLETDDFKESIDILKSISEEIYNYIS